MSNNFRLPATPAGDAGTGPLLATTDNGTSHEQWVRVAGGANPASTSATITTATSVVGGSVDYGSVGNVTVVMSGTYAGVNAAFEVSPDGGTTWVSLAGAREDNPAYTETVTGVLPANTTRAWSFGFFGFNRMRVRATAFTSGTANVTIIPGTLLTEPVISAISTRSPAYVCTNFSTVVAGVTGVTTEALISLVPTRAAVAAAAATAHSPTAGKTFRAQALSIAIANGAATQNGVRVYLRANPSGTATATSPILGMVGISAPNAVSGGMTGTVLPLDIDIPSSWSFGLTQIAAIASGSVHVHLLGFEF